MGIRLHMERPGHSPATTRQDDRPSLVLGASKGDGTSSMSHLTPNDTKHGSHTCKGVTMYTHWEMTWGLASFLSTPLTQLTSKDLPLKWSNNNCIFCSCSFCWRVSLRSHCSRRCSSADSNSWIRVSCSRTFIFISLLHSCCLRSASRKLITYQRWVLTF